MALCRFIPWMVWHNNNCLLLWSFGKIMRLSSKTVNQWMQYFFLLINNFAFSEFEENTWICLDHPAYRSVIFNFGALCKKHIRNSIQVVRQWRHLNPNNSLYFGWTSNSLENGVKNSNWKNYVDFITPNTNFFIKKVKDIFDPSLYLGINEPNKQAFVFPV